MNYFTRPIRHSSVTNEPFIPFDILPIIFTYLSLYTLIKIKTVSKAWMNQIESSQPILNLQALYQTMNRLEKEHHSFYSDELELLPEGILSSSINIFGQLSYSVSNTTYYDEDQSLDPPRLPTNFPFIIHLKGPVIYRIKKYDEHGSMPVYTTHSIYLTYKTLRCYASLSTLHSGIAHTILVPDKWKIKVYHPSPEQQQLVSQLIEAVKKMLESQGKSGSFLDFIYLPRSKSYHASSSELTMDLGD